MIDAPDVSHCATCTCGKRAPVLADQFRPAGTVAWSEHIEALHVHRRRHRADYPDEQIVERGGFSYVELHDYLGHEPKTWRPRDDL